MNHKTSKTKTEIKDSASLRKSAGINLNKETAARYRSMIDNIDNGYYEVDLAGNFTFFNEEVCRVLGYSREELMGQNYRQHTDKETANKVFQAYNKVYKTGKPVKELGYNIIRKDGSKRYIESSVSLRKNSSGKPIGFLGISNDLTERKRAEEALKERDIVFKKLSANVPGIIYQFQMKPDGSFCLPFSTDAVKDIYGCSPEDIVNDFSPIAKAVYHEDFDKFVESIKLSAKKMSPWQCEYRVQVPGKPLRWLLGTSTPEKLPDGSIIWHGFNTDITQRKKAEAETAILSNALKLALDPILILDLEGKVINVNEAAKRLFETEDLGVSALDYVAPEDKEKVTAKMQELLMGSGINVAEFTVITKSGRRVSIEATGNLIVDANGKANGLVVVERDITDRKRMEEALRQEQQFSKSVLDNLPEIFYLFTYPENRLRLSNKQVETLLGFNAEEIHDRHVTEWFAPEYRDAILKAIDEVMENGQSSIEAPLLAKDGHQIPFFLTGAKFEVDDQSYFMGIGMDLTERKQAEKELEKYRQHLEELVRERTIKLEASNKELEAFSYSASHDLRAPLRSIEGFSQALLEDYRDKLDIQGKDYLTRIKTATRRMADLIEDMLQLSRITRMEMNIEKVNLSLLARSVINELQKSQPQRHVEIRIADSLEDTADLRLMRIVLNNLLGNAWKFTERQAKAKIEFGLLKSEVGEKVYFIRDNGAGFDMAYSDKLFAPFQRLHADDEFPGTGIGLATVRRIVNRHGGKVWAEGEIDKGATFYFSLNEK
ncbi:MAG TPA: PAS domain-containing sensor histidine kinase [Smithella sp.]|jgi:PAS domain S-box-containing protein|nr:PAS domain-containing sensor histidine kinase [Smithella sp.]